MHLPIRIFAVVAALALAACATPSPKLAATAPTYQPLLLDAQFGERPAEVTASNVFALDDDMRRYLRDEMPRLVRRSGPIRGLLDALYDKGQLKLEYDAARTRTASEAFAARQGNCLSLVIMTGALARELGLDVRYQQVFTEAEWQRQGDLLVNANHVNLRLDTAPRDWKTLTRDGGTALVVDFLPTADASRLFASELSEATVLAMFMNNRAAESIAVGELRTAYWWARDAVVRDARFLPAYSTLAVIYRRSGLLEPAIAILAEALRHAPEDPVVLANQAGFLRDAGRIGEAAAIEARLKRIEPVPPYHWFHKGLAALKAGDYANAREWFAKDLQRQPHNAEFHFGMAAAFIGTGDLAKAREHFAQAREDSTTSDARALYSAKLHMIERRIACGAKGCEPAN